MKFPKAEFTKLVFKYGLILVGVLPQLLFAFTQPDAAILVQGILETAFGHTLPPGIVQAVSVFLGGYLLRKTPTK